MIAIALLSACSSPAQPPSSNVTHPGVQPTGSQDLSNAMNKFAATMCACKDSVCAEKVSAGFRPWMEEHARATTTENEASDAEVARYTEAFDRYTACLTKLSSNP